MLGASSVKHLAFTGEWRCVRWSVLFSWLGTSWYTLLLISQLMLHSFCFNFQLPKDFCPYLHSVYKPEANELAIRGTGKKKWD